VELCNRLAQQWASTGNYSGCLASDQISSACDHTTLRNCECLVLHPDHNSTRTTISHLRDANYRQAVVDFSLALLSLLLLLLHLSTYALAPRRMWKYPLNIAFWIYVCDLLVALQFAIVSCTRRDLTRRWSTQLGLP
jgi:hypothetical protein